MLWGGAASVVRYKRGFGCARDAAQTRASTAAITIDFIRMAHPLPMLPAGSGLCIQHISKVKRPAIHDNTTIFVNSVALARHDGWPKIHYLPLQQHFPMGK
jgi:hypothetical protein